MKYIRLLCVSTVMIMALNYRALGGGIAWEAEDYAAINVPMQVYKDKPEASGGKYVASPTSDQGSVEYEIKVPKAGTYFLWVRFHSLNTGENSWYFQVDDKKSVVGNADFVWDTLVPEQMPKEIGKEVGPLVEPGPAWEFKDEWSWIRLIERIDGQFNVLKVRVLKLSEGKHTLYLWGREPATKADVFYLSDTFNEQPVLPGEAKGVRC